MRLYVLHLHYRETRTPKEHTFTQSVSIARSGGFVTLVSEARQLDV